MKSLISFLTLTILSSCSLYDDGKKEVFMTDPDYVENYRAFSPDSSMILINYSLDLGAFGYGQSGTAILKLEDTTENLRDYSLSNRLKHIRWIDNQNISAEYDMLDYVRSGMEVDVEDHEVNGINIRVIPQDYIDRNDHLAVVHRDTSHSKKLELVAYRYIESWQDLKLLHISVIPVGKQLPKYGNYLIADKHSDYVFYATWSESDLLKLYSNSRDADLVQYYLVKNRPNVDYEIIIDDQKFGKNYRWIDDNASTHR